jgi:hypothetical protein
MSRNHATNIFDNLPAVSAPRIRELHDELDRYLSTDSHHVVDREEGNVSAPLLYGLRLSLNTW